MSCERWEVRLANGENGSDIGRHLAECDECRALAVELRENAIALAAMRDEMVPDRRVVRRRWPWVAALAAAAMLVVMLWPRSQAPAEPVEQPSPVVKANELPSVPLPPPAPAKPKPVVPRPAARPIPKPQATEPLLVKMLTDDPDVVIYWLIDGDEGERAI